MSTTSPAGSSEDQNKKPFEAFDGIVRGAYVIGRPVPVLKRILRPSFTWDDALPGLTFPALEYRIPRNAVEHYLGIVRQCIPDYPVVCPENVPPHMFADEANQCIGARYAKAGRIHASHSIEVIKSIPVGSLVRSRAEVVSRYERKGRQFYDVLCIVSLVENDVEYPAVKVTATLMP
jgi:hypothetical protein